MYPEIINKTTTSKYNKKVKNSPPGGKLPAHFVMAVYDEVTRKIIDCKQLINHSDEQTRKWWQKLSANRFRKLLKGVGRNEDGTQRVKELDTINFIRRMHVPIEKKITYARFCCDNQLKKMISIVPDWQWADIDLNTTGKQATQQLDLYVRRHKKQMFIPSKVSTKIQVYVTKNHSGSINIQ